MVNQKKQLAVYRNSFMRWLEGDLMCFIEGKGIVDDNIKHEEVEHALDRGDVVLLLDDSGKPITRLIQIDGVNTEQLLAEE